MHTLCGEMVSVDIVLGWDRKAVDGAVSILMAFDVLDGALERKSVQGVMNGSGDIPVSFQSEVGVVEPAVGGGVDSDDESLIVAIQSGSWEGRGMVKAAELDHTK